MLKKYELSYQNEKHRIKKVDLFYAFKLLKHVEISPPNSFLHTFDYIVSCKGFPHLSPM